MVERRSSDCDAQCIENSFTELTIAFIIRFSTLVTLYSNVVGECGFNPGNPGNPPQMKQTSIIKLFSFNFVVVVEILHLYWFERSSTMHRLDYNNYIVQELK